MRAVAIRTALQPYSVQHEADCAEQLLCLRLSALTLCIMLPDMAEPNAGKAGQLARRSQHSLSVQHPQAVRQPSMQDCS